MKKMNTVIITNRRLRVGAGGLIVMLTLGALLCLNGQPFFGRQERQVEGDSDEQVECRSVCKIPALVSGRQFYDYFTKMEYKCKNLRWFGANDGRKAVCMDPEFNLTRGDCHILSFGINDEWSFDDAFDHLGCKVYSFDPTMKKGDHQRSPNIQFFKLGIGNMKGKRKIGMDVKFDYFEVDRYENILARLGLTDKTIDYLKMDIELSELDFFQDVFRNSPHLLKNIKQIGMELHHGYFGEGLGGQAGKRNDMSPLSAFQIFWQYFQELKCHGFKLLHSRTEDGTGVETPVFLSKSRSVTSTMTLIHDYSSLLKFLSAELHKKI